MIDTVRGVLRVRAWPKKTGTPKSALQRWWNDWFRQANFLAKYTDGMSAARAIELTKGTGLYPRDIILRAMRGRLLFLTDETGKTWYPMAAIQDISDTLDILAQDIGSVLARATDRWRALPAGAAGEVLTSQGADVLPEWQPAAGGGGFEGGALVTRSTNQTYAGWATDAITYDTEVYDTSAIFDAGGDPTRLVVPADVTMVRLHAYVRLTTAGNYAVFFKKNGADFPGFPYDQLKNANNLSLVSAVVPVSPGDYFECFVYNQQSSTRYVAGGANYPSFSMQLL